MLEFVFAVIFAFLAFITGVGITEDHYQAKCIEKYASMPHNQVGDYCKTILKFEKDSK